MNIRFLEDSRLILDTKMLAAREREITLEILHMLKEIETRKLYLARGFSSLFEFCVEELGYSEGSANRRISSMRLMKQIPEAEVKIRENKVNLSTLSQLHSHIRREEKAGDKKIPQEEKIRLLAQIEGKSQDQCQRALLRHSIQPVRITERERALTDELTEIRFVATPQLMEKFKKLKGSYGP